MFQCCTVLWEALAMLCVVRGLSEAFSKTGFMQSSVLYIYVHIWPSCQVSGLMFNRNINYTLKVLQMPCCQICYIPSAITLQFLEGVSPVLHITYHYQTTHVVYKTSTIDITKQLLWHILTHLPLDKMAAILQVLFSDAFSLMKSFAFWLNFHWSLFLRVRLTITQHWFR